MNIHAAYMALVNAALKHTEFLCVIDNGTKRWFGGPTLWLVTDGNYEAWVWFDPTSQLYHWDGQHCQGAKRMILRINDSFNDRRTR